jgi:hypothetical protein
MRDNMLQAREWYQTWWQNASTSLDWNSSKFEAGTLFTLVPDLLVGAGNRHRYAG